MTSSADGRHPPGDENRQENTQDDAYYVAFGIGYGWPLYGLLQKMQATWPMHILRPM
jgi:hypothetical protein